MRQAIETGKSSMTVEQAGTDEACTFGKWLHAPGAFRDNHPDCWQQLRDPHKQFHQHAGKLLELSLAGRRSEVSVYTARSS